MKMKCILLKDFAKKIGCRLNTARTWLDNYQFNKFIFWGFDDNNRYKRFITINKEFLDIFDNYLKSKSRINMTSKKYYENFLAFRKKIKD